MKMKSSYKKAYIVIGLFMLVSVPLSIIAFIMGSSLEAIYLLVLTIFLFNWMHAGDD